MLHNGRRRRCQPEGFRLRTLHSTQPSCNSRPRVRRPIHNRETAAQITYALCELPRKLRSAGRHALNAKTPVERSFSRVIISGKPQHQLVLRAGAGNIQQTRLFGSAFIGHPLPGLGLPSALKPAHINPALQIIRLGAENRQPIALRFSALFSLKLEQAPPETAGPWLRAQSGSALHPHRSPPGS